MSTVYDMQNARRETLDLQYALNKFEKYLESIDGFVGNKNGKLGHVEELSDSCEEISQVYGNFFVGSQLFCPKILQPTTVD